MKIEKTDTLQQIPLISHVTLAQISGLSLQSAKQKLSRWVGNGRVLRLKNALYIQRDFYLSHKDREWFAVWVSCAIQKQSYVSREWVLQKHGILTEITYPVTAMSQKNTRVFSNDTGTYRYYHLQDQLFTGYSENNYYGVICREASKAKALFDYFYSKKVTLPDAASTERLNLEDFSNGDRQEFARYVKIATSPKMNKILVDLRSNVWS